MENVMIEEPTRRADMESEEAPVICWTTLSILQDARGELLRGRWNARSEFFYYFLCDAISHVSDGRPE